MTNVPVEPRAAAQSRWGRSRWLRFAPGALALTLFLALALGHGVLGAAAAPLQGALALALLASIVAQPGVLSRLRITQTAVALAGILTVALFLRVWGLRFGLPYFEHPDEWAIAEDALRMLRTGDYTPFSYTYPTLYTYMQVGVAAAHFMWGAGAGLYRTPADIDPVRFYVWARALTAMLGVGAVALTFLAGRMLYGNAAGLLAAALIAVMPAVTGDSHYVTTDTPAMFFTLLAFLAIARLGGVASERTALKDMPFTASPWNVLALAFLAGFGVGLATATKWNAGSLVVALLVAIVCAVRGSDVAVHGGDVAMHGGDVAMQRRYGRRATFNVLTAALLGILLGFTLGVPFWLRDLPRILTDLAGIIAHYRFEGHPGAESDQPALFYWWALTREGTLLAWACLGGVALAFLRRRSADILVLAVVVPAVLQLTSVKVVFFRNAMPLLPFLCILAAALVVVAVEWVTVRSNEATDRPAGRQSHVAFVQRLAGNRTTLLLAATVVLTAEPLAQAVHDELLRSRPTTRMLSRRLAGGARDRR
ncbi:MAG: phospholipid carrier-dependent glycosyltransferase [Roseiflexaceae bacterium]|nr:phospholipid carrier-dependent glycosyltransferase [Roseiflexaceae bacterium]